MSKLFVTGTDTGIGKTVVMTLLTEALTEEIGPVFPYKPIETGVKEEGERTDVETYQFVMDPVQLEHRTYAFSAPYSPHFAARLEKKSIDIVRIQQDIANIEAQYEGVLIEGAGGLFVPLQEKDPYIIDLIKTLQTPVILVASTTLGTINHTLLSILALKKYHIPIVGLLFNLHDIERETELDNIRLIERETKLPIIGTVPKRENIVAELQTKEGREGLRNDWKVDYCLPYLRRKE